jgi:hypothetical protein
MTEPTPTLEDCIAGYLATDIPASGSRRVAFAVRLLANPRHARNRCGSATDGFYWHLFYAWPDRHHDSNRLKGVATIEVRFASHPDVPHMALYVNGLVVDWTARQFDPTSPFPIVEPFEHYCARLARPPSPQYRWEAGQKPP